MPSTTALYRKSTGEVLRVARANAEGRIQMWPQVDTRFFGVAIDPLTPDGDKVFDDSTPIGGPRRVLGWAKHYDAVTNTVRNSLQVEINSYAAGEQADRAKLDAGSAKEIAKTHPVYRKLISGIVKMINQTRSDAGLTPWTKADIVNFLDTNITEND